MLDKRVFQWCDALNEVQTVSMIEHAIKFSLKESRHSKHLTCEGSPLQSKDHKMSKLDFGVGVVGNTYFFSTVSMLPFTC